MENSNEPKKSKFSEQPHYFQWGLTAFCVIGCCVLVAFVLIKLPFIWNVVKKLFGALSPFIYGFVMAYLLMPVFNMLYRLKAKQTVKVVVQSLIKFSLVTAYKCIYYSCAVHAA